MKTNNHYVPRTYLKQWANGSQIFEYTLIVSHENVPVWKESSISRTSSVESLYVYFDKGELNDEMEDFFSEKFEMKYNSFLDKINSRLQLDEQDKDYISKLVASQHLRTLNGFRKIQRIVEEKWPEIIEKLVKKMEDEIKINGTLTVKEVNKDDALVPLKVKIHSINDEESSLELQSYNGKSYWIFAMKHLLESTYKVLNNVSWCIFDAPQDFSWVTTDDPIIFLNYHGPINYDFEGGWGVKNTNIIYPLTPKKLLFAEIGRTLKTYDTATHEFAKLMQEYIVMHAFSCVYSNEKNQEITEIRKRIVNQKMFKELNDSLKKLHKDYMSYEVPYLKRDNKE